MKQKALIIVPAYNEGENIGRVLDRILAETKYRDIIVINDGSTDRTADIVREMGVDMLDLPFNMGIGATLQAGYIFALRKGYDYVVRIDADGQHEVCQIDKLLKPIIDGESDLVIGSRYIGYSTYRSSLPRRIGIRLLSGVVSWIVGMQITDTTSGFRAFNHRVVSVFSRCYPDDYPEVESIVSMYRMGFRIKEVGVDMARRTGGRSSITFIRSIYYMFKVFLAIMIEPLRASKENGNDETLYIGTS